MKRVDLTRIDKSFSELPPETKGDWRLVMMCLQMLRSLSRKRLLDLMEREALQSLAASEEGEVTK